MIEIILLEGLHEQVTFSSKPEMIILLCILPCVILIAVGIAFFIAYAVGKRTWAKELVELDGEQADAQE